MAMMQVMFKIKLRTTDRTTVWAGRGGVKTGAVIRCWVTKGQASLYTASEAKELVEGYQLPSWAAGTLSTTIARTVQS